MNDLVSVFRSHLISRVQFAKSRAFQAQQNIAQSEEELAACRAETQRLRRIRVLLNTMETAADEAIRVAGTTEGNPSRLVELKDKVAKVQVD
jgi:predicted nucleotidyltransferase